MPGNSNLNDSSVNKQDEFYTPLSLIEDELRHYRKHFEGKSVLCNCDDPYESNFFKYFASNFNFLKLKSLTATCFSGSRIAGQELDLFGDNGKTSYAVRINEVKDGAYDLSDVRELLRNNKNLSWELKEDGRFQSAECVEMLKSSDIIVTNPPFSQFREYMGLLMKYEKDFLIIGNMNNVTYKEIFPLVRENKIWLGYNAGHYWFKVPDSYEEKKTDFKIDEDGQKWRRMGNICWFTNLYVKKRHEDLVLFRNYSAEKYPSYDNYDAIHIDKTVNIPCDYWKLMGVPVSFMQYHNPEQFEIVGCSANGIVDDEYKLPHFKRHNEPYVNGKSVYQRILIRRLR